MTVKLEPDYWFKQGKRAYLSGSTPRFLDENKGAWTYEVNRLAAMQGYKEAQMLELLKQGK